MPSRATCSTTCRRSVEERARAQLKLYRGGHMFYIDPQSRKAFTADAGVLHDPVHAAAMKRSLARQAGGDAADQPVRSGAQGRHSRGADRARRIRRRRPSGKNSGRSVRAGRLDLSLRVFRRRSNGCAATTTISTPSIAPHAALDHAIARTRLRRSRRHARPRCSRTRTSSSCRMRRSSAAHRERAPCCASRSRRRSTISARCASSAAATTSRRFEVAEWFGLRKRKIEAEVYDDVVLIVAMKPARRDRLDGAS